MNAIQENDTKIPNNRYVSDSEIAALLSKVHFDRDCNDENAGFEIGEIKQLYLYAYKWVNEKLQVTCYKKGCKVKLSKKQKEKISSFLEKKINQEANKIEEPIIEQWDVYKEQGLYGNRY